MTVDSAHFQAGPGGRAVCTVRVSPGRWTGEVTADDVRRAGWPNGTVDHLRIVIGGADWRADTASAIASRLVGRCGSWSIDSCDPVLARQVGVHLARLARDGAA